MTTATDMPTFRLDGRTALVTGAGSGIGAALAEGLAEFGADVACVDLDEGLAEQTAVAVRRRGRRALALAANTAQVGALDRCVERLEVELGPLTLAVNCAGVHSAAPAEDMEAEVWQRLVDVNLTGVFRSCQAEGRAMIRNGGGSIVNLGSISGRIANRGIDQVHYNSTKAAVAHLSRSLAIEWVSERVRVNTLSPGLVRTGLSRGVVTTRPAQEFVDEIPMRRVAHPVEMVGPTVFLLSDAASYCTGTDLVVDGGATLW